MKRLLGLTLAFGIGMSGGAQGAKETALSMHGDVKHTVDAPLPYMNPKAPKGGLIRFGVVGTFDTTNPFVTKGTPPAGLSLYSERLVFEPLMKRSGDEPFTLYGLLAEKYDIAPDRSWIIFYINPKAKWADGKPVTAKDVLFTFETLREKGQPNMRLYYGRVETAELLEGNAIKFTFKKTDEGTYDPEQPLLMALMSVIPAHFFEGRDFEKASLEPLMGSGPYRIKIIEPGRRISYERRPDYWAKDLPIQQGQYNFEEVRFDFYRDSKVAFEAFKAGAYDIYADADPSHWRTAYDFPAARQGRVIKQEWSHHNPVGLKGFAMNMRRPFFQDARVRRAFIEAFDFETLNRTLFGGEYTRSHSFFSNTELASQEIPQGKEKALLETIPDLPKALFTESYHVPRTDGSGRDRKNLKKALTLLQAAGYQLRAGKLVDAKTGTPFVFEILLYNPEDQKIALAYAKNLKVLGIDATIRTVDPTQYESRRLKFDYDMIIHTWGHSLSPGAEQKHYWTSRAAKEEGSRNYPGIQSKAIDLLCDAVSKAKDRESLVIAIRALDRALLWGDYVVPLYYSAKTRLAYWDKFGYPEINPRVGVVFSTWWHKP
ncbi:MAG: extracellular solute-binding protein [Alphaproteobacteria bacterium]|nr:extracellular solute-binding protein [Alphaproteobacteria bacterium]